MKRKIVAQGIRGRTVFLPITWIRENNLVPGDEIDIIVQENNIIITPQLSQTKVKSASLTLHDSSASTLRSLIGSYYKQGYSEIRITNINPHILLNLQDTIDSLFGLELFNITQDSCTIRCLFNGEISDIKNYVSRMIHLVGATIETITSEMNSLSFNSSMLIKQYRLNSLKQRDVVHRLIIQHRLLDSMHFPYYEIVTHLWHITRNLNHMYAFMIKQKYVDDVAKQYFVRVADYFRLVFGNLNQAQFTEVHQKYDELFQEGGKLLMDSKNTPAIVSFCLNTVLEIQSVNSAIMGLHCKLEAPQDYDFFTKVIANPEKGKSVRTE